jgi:hypothetical protein
LGAQLIDPKLILWVWANDWQRQTSGEFVNTPCVINVGMGDPNLLQLDIQLGHAFKNDLQVASRINHSGLMGFIAP